MISFNEIATRVPVNKEAALSLVPSESFTFRYGNRVRSATPLPITTIPLPNTDKRVNYVDDMTGKIVGRLTVIGRFYDPKWGNGEHVRWVVRCTCGYYETRRNKGIRKLTIQQSMCSQCEALERYKSISARGTYSENERSEIKRVVPCILAETVSETPRFYKKTPIPPEIRWRVWERDNFTCKRCGSRKHLSVDHILAESKGGMMVLDNLQTLCGRCNSKKGAR